MNKIYKVGDKVHIIARLKDFTYGERCKYDVATSMLMYANQYATVIGNDPYHKNIVYLDIDHGSCYWYADLSDDQNEREFSAAAFDQFLAD